MILYQPTLKNFGHVTLMHEYATQKGIKLILSKHGVLHTVRMICPDCDCLCNYNGSNKTGNILSRSIHAFMKKGQQRCPLCGRTFQIDNEFIDAIILESNQFIMSTALSLREKSMSYRDIARHLFEIFDISVSVATLRDVCEEKLSEYDDLDIEFEVEDDFYGYDEQYIRVNGKAVFRIVIFDYKNNCPIYEAKHEHLTKKILMNILRKVFGNKIPKGFIFDMRTMYPDAFKLVFGRKIKLQYCVFHLHKRILKEFCESLRVGKKPIWSLVQYLNMYGIFNIFYNREQQLELLKTFQKELSNYKEALEIIEDVETYKKDVSIPKKCKTRDDKIKYLIEIYEKELIKKFREHLHAEKLRRKRDNETLKSRTKEDAKNKLDKIIRISNLFPKKIEARVQKIKKDFELFTGSDGAHLTNNKLEGFFGATLNGPQKKGFHSDKALGNFFKFRKLRQAGTKIFEPTPISALAVIFGVIAALPLI